MFFKAIRKKPQDDEEPRRLHPALAVLPVKIGEQDPAEVFARPLEGRLAAAGLGAVTGTHMRYSKSGEGHAVALDLALSRPDLATLKAVGILLEDLDAPLTPIPGDIPSPLERPSGCVFHPRNPELQPGSRYAREVPPMTEVRPGHFAALFPEDVA